MKFIKKAILVVTVLLFTSCATQTKESYLLDFEKFISEVSANHQDYSTKDWDKKNKEFNTFKSVLQDKYKEELTWQDEVTIGKYEITYNLAQFKKEVPNFLNIFNGGFEEIGEQLKKYTENEMGDDMKKIKEEIEKATEQLKYYTENNMKEDIEKFKTEMKKMGKDFDKMGKEVEKTLEKMFEELETEVESKK